MGHPSTKDLLHEAADRLPPEASMEEAMERLLLLAKIERGRADVEAGRVIEHDEVRRRLDLAGVDSRLS